MSAKRKPKPIRLLIMFSCVAIFLILVLIIYITTYSIFFSRTRSAVNEQMSELNGQIVLNYENYIASIVETADYIQRELVPQDLSNEQNQQVFSSFLNLVVNLKSDVKAISIYDNESKTVLVSDDVSSLSTTADISEQTWYIQANEDTTIYCFNVVGSNDNEYKIITSKQIIYRNKPVTMKMEMSFENFVNIVKKSNLGEFGHITIIDNEYQLVYSSIDKTFWSQDVQFIQDIILGTKEIVYNNFSMSLTVDTLTNTQWRICTFINFEQLKMVERDFLINLTIATVSVLLAGLGILSIVARRITDPLQQLEEVMQNVENSNYFPTYKLNSPASKEIEALTESFNKMMRRINELVSKVIVEQTEQRKSELKALQNQINPHFLYNTMDSIMWLIEQKKNEEAAEMLSSLAKLFRISISRGKNIVSVRDEVEHVKNYLKIQSVRYSAAFKYEIDVADDVYECNTIKLILQPVVENCLYHGLKDRVEEGIINISISRSGDNLVFAIKDNGYGITDDKIDELYEKFVNPNLNDGVGLKNIYQRLLLYYGGKGSLTIASVLDDSTTVTIIQPIVGSKEE